MLYRLGVRWIFPILLLFNTSLIALRLAFVAEVRLQTVSSAYLDQLFSLITIFLFPMFF